MRIIYTLFLLICSAFATDTRLHVSTWPSAAEVTLGDRSGKALLSPSEYQVSLDSSPVLLHFFKPGFRDTTVRVRLQNTPKNYLYFHLAVETDSAALATQSAFLRERTKRLWSSRLFYGTAAPTLLGAFFAWQAQDNFAQSSHAKDKFQNGVLAGTSEAQALTSSIQSHNQRGNDAKTRAYISLAATGLLLVGGTILRF